MIHRVFFLRHLLFFQFLFSQVNDIGFIIDSQPKINLRDSLGLLIYEAQSSSYTLNTEGGAIDVIGNSIEEVTFQLKRVSGVSEKISGRVFGELNSNRKIVTFLHPKDQKVRTFSFKIITRDSISVNSILVFLAEEEELPGLTKPLEPLVADVPKPTIISREEWGAEDPKNIYSYHPYYDKLTLHHAACCSADDLEEGKEQVYWIQDFHQNGRGWNDIGYHFLVDRAGNIYQGRPETVIGAHVGGANTGNIGVCLLGCYHPPELSCLQTMTEESQNAIVELFSWVSNTYGQEPSVLLGHRDYFGTTACPGDNLWIELPRFRAEISDFIRSYLEIPSISLFQPAYPNPFSDQVTFSYSLREGMDLSLDIYDLLGRKVRSISRMGLLPGNMFLQWDGKNSQGDQLAAGVYFVKPVSKPDIDATKIILMKK